MLIKRNAPDVFPVIIWVAGNSYILFPVVAKIYYNNITCFTKETVNIY